MTPGIASIRLAEAVKAAGVAHQTALWRLAPKNPSPAKSKKALPKQEAPFFLECDEIKMNRSRFNLMSESPSKL
jgi:hypothetical protein